MNAEGLREAGDGGCVANIRQDARELRQSLHVAFYIVKQQAKELSMRLQGKSGIGPSVLVGIAGFLVLVLLVVSQRRATLPLSQQFVPRPTVPGDTDWTLPALPSELAQQARTALARLTSGEAARPVTSRADNGLVEVAITQLQGVPQGLQIKGEARNIGAAPFAVSLTDFRFTDGQGVEYAADQGVSTTLQPGQRAPLDLTLPITRPQQLSLLVQLPNQAPLTMTLVQTQ